MKHLTLLLLVFTTLCLLFVSRVQSTASECHGPSHDNDGGPKRGGVVLSYDESEDTVHVSLLSSHKYLQPPPSKSGQTKPTSFEQEVLQLMTSDAKQQISANPSTYKVTGPTNLLTSQRTPFDGTKTRCVACRLNCKSLNVFRSCKEKYYYYGCRQQEPCYNKTNADDSTIQTAIGICIEKNGCKLRKVDQQGGTPLELVMHTVLASPYSPEDQ